MVCEHSQLSSDRTNSIPMDLSAEEEIFGGYKKYYFDDPYLFKYYPDQLLRRCVSNDDQIGVLTFCHSEACGGHFSARKKTNKILQASFYWPT